MALLVPRRRGRMSAPRDTCGCYLHHHDAAGRSLPRSLEFVRAKSRPAARRFRDIARSRQRLKLRPHRSWLARDPQQGMGEHSFPMHHHLRTSGPRLTSWLKPRASPDETIDRTPSIHDPCEPAGAQPEHAPLQQGGARQACYGSASGNSCPLDGCRTAEDFSRSNSTRRQADRGVSGK